MYTLFSDYNVVILYDGTFVEVNRYISSSSASQQDSHNPDDDEQVIPAPWVKGQHCGVCGNFDGNTKNEMQDKVLGNQILFMKK